MERRRVGTWWIALALLPVGLVSDAAWSAETIGPAPVLLWPDGAPGAKGDGDADKPAVRIYPAPGDTNSGAAVVVCPGGGYGILATDHEGIQVARFLNTIGVNAFVLRYRVAPYRHPAPLNDVQRSIRFVRSGARKWGVSPRRIGVMGFSAGGHLASTAATHFSQGQKDAADPIERVGCRPDFAILAYPVITMTADFGHQGSKRNLLGKRVNDKELAEKLSSEKQVTAETSPTFLFHTGEDKAVPVENSLAFYAALKKARVPAELHVYQYGPHGVGLAPASPVVSTWKRRLADWLRTSGFLSDTERAAVSGEVTLSGKAVRWGMIAFLPNNKRDPIAWGRVSRGKFAIPAHRGAAVGTNRMMLYLMGDVRAEPTVEDVVQVPTPLTFVIKPGSNKIDLAIQR